MPDEPTAPALRTLIVDDEPLAVERMQIICAGLPALNVVGTASDGAAALRLVEALHPDLVLLDMTMPELDGLGVARRLASVESPQTAVPPAIVFVTAHDSFAVEAFDLDAVDYVLKPVTPERLERAIGRALARRNQGDGQSRSATGEASESQWIAEFWVPHRSELLRIAADDVTRIDAERDYVRLHVAGKLDQSGPGNPGQGHRSYLLLQTIAGLEERLDPARFIRVHRSVILRRDHIVGLRHDGLGVWSVELADGPPVRIGRTYLARVKAIAGR